MSRSEILEQIEAQTRTNLNNPNQGSIEPVTPRVLERPVVSRPAAQAPTVPAPNPITQTPTPLTPTPTPAPVIVQTPPAQVIVEAPVLETPTKPEVVVTNEPGIIEIIGEPEPEPEITQQPIEENRDSNLPGEVVQLGRVRLGWDNSYSLESGQILNNDDIQNFELIYGNSPDTMNSSVQVINTTEAEFEINNLPAGNYYFAIRVITKAGTSSEFSNSVYAAIL